MDQISRIKYQISSFKYQVPNIKYQISNIKFETYRWYPSSSETTDTLLVDYNAKSCGNGWVSADDGWWMMDDGWYVVEDTWWMIRGGWWMMMDGGWWITRSGWWMIQMNLRILISLNNYNHTHIWTIAVSSIIHHPSSIIHPSSFIIHHPSSIIHPLLLISLHVTLDQIHRCNQGVSKATGSYSS